MEENEIIAKLNADARAKLRAMARIHQTTDETTASLLLNGLLGGGAASVPIINTAPDQLSPEPLAAVTTRVFDVAKDFPDYPPQSKDFAQRFVDTAVSFPNVRPFKQGRGVGFRPRFAQIEYLISFRGKKPGIVVSIYGDPKQYHDPDLLLSPDRKSYSRMTVTEAWQLEKVQSFARQAYAMRCHVDLSEVPDVADKQ